MCNEVKSAQDLKLRSLLSVQVKLYKSESLDNPIQTVSLGQSLFFHFPPLLRDGEVSQAGGTPAL